MLKHKRRGQKGSITKRIEELKRLISESGSRTKIRFLYDKLMGMYNEMSAVAANIYSITNDFADEEWLQQETIRVDDISSDINEYLEARKDDADSTERTASWVHEYCPSAYETTVDNTEEAAIIQDMMQDLTSGTKADGQKLSATASAYSHQQQEGKVDHATASSKHDPESLKVTQPVAYDQGTVPPISSERGYPGSHDESLLSSLQYRQYPIEQGVPRTWVDPTSQFQFRPPLLQESYSNYDFTIPSSILTAPPSIFVSSFHVPPPSKGNVIPSSMLGTRLRTSDPILSLPGVRPSYNATSSSARLSYVSQAQFNGRGISSTSLNLPTNPTHTCAPNRSVGATHVVGSNGYAPPGRSANAHQPTHVIENSVDSWIDLLDVNRANVPNPTLTGIAPDVTMAYLVQQNLPRTQLPTFDGSPTKWVSFITKFRDVIHLQEYLTDSQRCHHLVQHLEGSAERSVTRFTHDSRGYVLALQRLKFLFGQKSKIAQATLREVTQGEVVRAGNKEDLEEF